MIDKFCKDCKHVGGVPSEEVDPPCNAPQNFVENVNQAKYLVTGIAQPIKKIRRGASCSALRMKRTPEIDATTCGPDGKWFAPKEEGG
ncbi:hypothetical protein [Microbacterium sp.]|uniref:hypothetical protein n=1 Tax=Microbacterium sp. TaxID=51671 RepID=UPI0027343C17|nr:hypothetical protein [Microbacterium sp.]MDP3952645.1 hypothetical protein [Microbacterium sp.]